MALARQVASTLGDDSWLVRRIRPVREWALAAMFNRSGLARTVNGVPLKVLPGYRWYFRPDYDGPVAAFFRERVRPGDVCFSVGANIGVYPLQFAAWSAPTGRVFAFEPNPDTAAVLRRHIRINRIDDRVTVLARAVAERPGTATFHAAGVDGMSRLGEPNPLLSGKTTAIIVEVESLDEFCRREGVVPSIMMVDVEGFEGAVLSGARSLFAGGSPFAAVVEMHPNAWPVAGFDRASFERLLAELRVRLVPLSGQADPLGEYGHVFLEPIA